ncbi:MAG: DUF58 domain-containing protein, partial [Kiloniellales bacterium]|nr:DUF58 domain-containing protein [Kiloniellales bacterium]
EGLEGEDPWLLSRAENVREDYRNRLELQRDGLNTISRRLGWSFITHRSDHSPETALLSLYMTLAGRAGE